VLVFHDLLGMAFGKLPRFVREYANLRETITDAVTRWAEDVRSGTYPSDAESYGLPADAAKELKNRNEGEGVATKRHKRHKAGVAVRVQSLDCKEEMVQAEA